MAHMEQMWPISGTLLLVIVAVFFLGRRRPPQEVQHTQVSYKYVAKSYIMTEPEAHFFKRLQVIAAGKYFVFPQVHLSSLASNITPGKYHKAGFQRINRRSVDYVLVDMQTLRAAYAIELDDKTHDTQKGRAVDSLKTEILQQIGLPLVRFRDVQSMTDDDIVRELEVAGQESASVVRNPS